MASKHPPAHDFAPAWLKIPSYNDFKPTGAASERGSHTSRRDEHSLNYGRYNKEADSPYHSYFNDSRRDRDEFENDLNSSANNTSYGTDNSFNGSSNNQSRRPHSRHDFRMFSSLSYAKTDNSKHMTKNGSGFFNNKGKLKPHDNNISSNGTSDRGIRVTCNNFNQEFPSLQGDLSEEPTTPPALNGSAWEKPHSIKTQNPVLGMKIQLVKKPPKSDGPPESAKKSSGVVCGSLSKSVIPCSQPPSAKGSNCRPLIPSKSTIIKKPVKESSLRLANKKCPASSHSMEILVKHVKAPGNKSDFLKALRNERKDDKDTTPTTNGDQSDGLHINGMDISKLTFNEENKKSCVLSSSLEAEERLLREMGWKEEVSDDENYAPLTEDELREFRDRSEKILKKNGIRRNLLANLSPLRLPSFPSVPPPTENASSSSSESDSDSP